MDNDLKPMLDYIDNNITKKINMETLVCVSFYSAIQIYRKFIVELNATPMNYVKRRKLFFAAKDIISGNKKIADLHLNTDLNLMMYSSEFSSVFMMQHRLNFSQIA